MIQSDTRKEPEDLLCRNYKTNERARCVLIRIVLLIIRRQVFFMSALEKVLEMASELSRHEQVNLVEILSTRL
jgi:hypothetical protein